MEEANLEDREASISGSHQEQLDAIESIFQTHASGLKNAFERLAEQHYELLVSTGALSRNRLNINSNLTPLEKQLKPVEEQREATGMLKNSNPVQVGGDGTAAEAKTGEDGHEAINDTAGTAGDPTGKLAIAVPARPNKSRWGPAIQAAEERQLHQQFNRLDDDGSTEIDQGVLVAQLAGFGQEFQVENIPAVVKYIAELEGNDAGLNFRNFVVLMTDTRLTEHPTPKNIQYEVARLREGLKKESDAALHQDITDTFEAAAGPKGRYKQFFDFVPTSIVVCNAVTIGVSNDVDQNALYWLGFETFFFLCYFIEAMAKISLYGSRWYFCGEERIWNIFDGSCMLLSGAEISVSFAVIASNTESPLSVLMILKILRLARIVRLVRTLRLEVFKELKIMVMGVLSGLRVLGWAMVLLFILIYIFGMAFSSFLSDNEPEFATVDASMLTLFRCFSDSCDGFNAKPLIPRLNEKYGLSFLISYILMWMTIVLGVFNLIMAVFVDAVMEDHAIRKTRSIAETARRFEVDIMEHLLRLSQNQSAIVSQNVKEEIEGIAESASNRAVCVRAQFQCLAHASVVISRSAFDVYMSDEKLLSTLTEAEIEVDHGRNIFDFLDADMGGYLTAVELLQGLVSLRGPVSKLEIVGMRLKIRHIIKLLHHAGMTVAHE